MKKNITFLISYFLFWVLFFEVCRALFLILNLSKTANIPVLEIGFAFLKGLWLDFSITSYFCIFPILLVVFLGQNKTELLLQKLMTGYTCFLLFVSSFLVLVDAKLYQFWELKLTVEPLKYLSNPKELVHTIRFIDVLAPFFCISILVFGFYFLYKRYLSAMLMQLSPFSIYRPLLVLLFGGLIFFPIRGGIDLKPKIALGLPISASAAYYSKFTFCNHASLNPIWYCIYSYSRAEDKEKLYAFYEENKVNDWIKKSKQQEGETQFVLNQKRPNIVLIIVESLSANVFGPLGGNAEGSPKLSEWCNQSLLFKNFYASGTRSDRGISALITGIPSTPNRCIMDYPPLFSKTPFVYKTLQREKYNSSFFYGGDLNFLNFESFFLEAQVDNIVSRADYPMSEWKSKWGVPDDKMLSDFLESINNQKQPFFSSIFTLSSHHPFDIPVPLKFKENNDDFRFLSAIHFTDDCIGTFLQKAKSQSWWQNTLVVLVSDHSVGHFSKYENNHPNRFHIPMIWTGGALKNEYKGKTIDHFGGQADFATTLFAQLEIGSEEYHWGKNILQTKPNSFAYYSNSEFVGYVSENTQSIYNFVSKEQEDSIGISHYPFDPAKAYFQALTTSYYQK